MRRLLFGPLIFSALVFQVACAHKSTQPETRAMLHLKLGTSYLTQRRYPEAMTQLTQAEELAPDDPSIQNSLGLVYDVRGKRKEAEKHFRKALNLNPKYTDARANLARLLIDEDRVDEAIKLLTIVQNDLTYPYPDKADSLMGMAQFKKHNYTSAESYLQRSISANRSSCVAANFYGRTLYMEKKLQDAAHMLDLAIENCRSAGFEEPLFYAGLCYYRLGDTDKAKARLEELIQKHPESQYVKKAKGLLALLQ